MIVSVYINNTRDNHHIIITMAWISMAIVSSGQYFVSKVVVVLYNMFGLCLVHFLGYVEFVVTFVSLLVALSVTWLGLCCRLMDRPR